MPTYRELLSQVKAEIEEIDASEGVRLLDSDDAPLFLDVREQDEWDQGVIPGAVHIPRGYLEQRVEGLLPEHDRPIVVYCAGGSRSAFATKTLEELGYESVVNLAGGFPD
jgi:sulfur-carrier protein adenylyltransferase/sulfurtransferase